jgi:glycosyltransferase involved in cell wall biosynthesis
MCKKLTIIIPAYNEEISLKSFLPKVIDFCEANSFSLIIVNDGSKDGTKDFIESVKSENFTVYNHKVNKGYGGAIKTGIYNSKTKYLITIDADGQHCLEDINKLYFELTNVDADMVVGNRKGQIKKSYFRKFGKFIIRIIAKWLLPIKIHDINSGMKIYDADLAKKYISLCPNSMAYSDIITLIFISQRHLVREIPISIHNRTSGKSTISIKTAFETIKEILNIVILFNPMRVFIPLSSIFVLIGIAWGLPFAIKGNGVSTGALLAIITGIIFFVLGLIAEQLSQLRKSKLDN